MFMERHGLVKKQSVGGEPNKGKTQVDVSFGNGGSATSYTDVDVDGMLVHRRVTPRVLIGFFNGSLVNVYTLGWRDNVEYMS